MAKLYYFKQSVKTSRERKRQYPRYRNEAERLRSYGHWPKMMRQRPQSLSKAGFFYTQTGDRVICFSCGKMFCEWETDQEPWKRHALESVRCEYVKRVRGQDYIDLAIAEHILGILRAREPTDTTLQTPSADGDFKLCRICCSSDRDTAFYPCGHVIACSTCSASLENCPVCRRPYEKVLKIYFCVCE